jgi:hypothetical protein
MILNTIVNLIKKSGIVSILYLIPFIYLIVSIINFNFEYVIVSFGTFIIIFLIDITNRYYKENVSTENKNLFQKIIFSFPLLLYLTILIGILKFDSASSRELPGVGIFFITFGLLFFVQALINLFKSSKNKLQKIIYIFILISFPVSCSVNIFSSIK